MNLDSLEAAARTMILAGSRSPQLFQLGPEKGRQALEEAQALDGPEPIPQAEIEDLVLPIGPRGRLQLRIVRPRNAPALLPVIVYAHGAGWVFGSARTHDRLIRELAIGAQAALAFPSYSRSPEAVYPQAIEEIFAACAWVAREGAARGLDADRLAIAGDSVGGNMAAAVTLLAKKRGGPKIGMQLLFYPVTNAAFDTPSYLEFAEGFLLSREAMGWFWDQYAPSRPAREEITASPLRASLQDLEGLPPALIITAEADVLRDEGEAYAGRLRQAGVTVSAARFLGITHDFVMLNALAGTSAARAAIAMATDWLRKGWQLEIMLQTAQGGADEESQ